MFRSAVSRLRFSLLVFVLAPAAFSATLPVGTVNLDLTGLPGTATIDVVNQTGPNASTFPDNTFPVSTSVPFTNLNLSLYFAGGVTESFGPSYFTLTSDGLSFDGSAVSISTALTKAVLAGNFNGTSWTLNDGSTSVRIRRLPQR